MTPAHFNPSDLVKSCGREVVAVLTPRASMEDVQGKHPALVSDPQMSLCAELSQSPVCSSRRQGQSPVDCHLHQPGTKWQSGLGRGQGLRPEGVILHLVSPVFRKGPLPCLLVGLVSLNLEGL